MSDTPMNTKPSNIVDEFKPSPKSKDNGNSHPRKHTGKTKKDKARKAVNESISVSKRSQN